MSPTDTLPDDGKPTIDAMLKNADWESRLAEARVKREAVLAAKAEAKAQEQAREEAAKPFAPVRNTARGRRKPADVSIPPASLRHQNAPRAPSGRWQRRLAIIGGLGICAGMTALVLWRAFG